MGAAGAVVEATVVEAMVVEVLAEAMAAVAEVCLGAAREEEVVDRVGVVASAGAARAAVARAVAGRQ